tara:strand:- start:672 stop:1283 length:612 start_codon:yes stop_codon:yes gene_type:complete
MVEKHLRTRGITDSDVLAAMGAVQRHEFVPLELREQAYADRPLPIGFQQTISQPYIVAYMTELLNLKPEATVLEIGTGSGYQTAVLAEIVRHVYTIEIVPELARRSRALLTELGYTNITFREGDGYQGWPELGLFDGIIVAAAPEKLPEELVKQLATGARLVIPLGKVSQRMTVVTKTIDGSTIQSTIPVRFVSMTGQASTDR